MKEIQIHGPLTIPTCATPDAIMQWYKDHPEAAKGVDLVALKKALDADLAEKLKNGSARLATPRDQKTQQPQPPFTGKENV